MHENDSLHPRGVLDLVPWLKFLYASWRVRAQRGHFRCLQNSVYL